MKRNFWLTILYVGLTLIVGNFSFAKDYEYKNLDIQADIKIDGTIDVKETFTTNFLVRKHGIIRTIPLNYSVEGKNFHINISDVYVEGSKFTMNKDNKNLEIKIGDANRTVFGEQIYPISYSTYGLIRNFSGMGYAELYWNLVGYDFDTNINNFRAELTLPKIYTGFTNDDFLITTDGKSKTIDGFEGKVDWSQGDKIIINYNKTLPEKQGITLAIKFPNNYFEFNHDRQAGLVGGTSSDGSYGLSFVSELSNIFDYLLRKVPITILIFIIIVVIIFKSNPQKKEEHLEKLLNEDNNPFIEYSNIDNSKIEDSGIRKELNDKNPIVVRYTPPEGINCAEAGMLYNCILEPTDLTSLLYKWIIDGLISVQLDNDTGFSTVRRFVMTKLKDIDKNCPQYEIDFFDALLPGSINSKKAISTTSDFDIVRSLKGLRNYGESKGRIKVGYFNLNFNILNFKKLKNLIVGFMTALIFFFIFISEGIHYETALIISLFIGLFSTFRSSSSNYPTQKKIYLTKEGETIASQVIGYAQFIKMCDENKLRLFLKQDPTFFDKVLPYAVAFGFESQFIKKITPILNELDIRPTRYEGNISDADYISRVMRDMVGSQEFRREKERESISSYDTNSGFSGGSSFGGGFSVGGGGGGGGSRSW